MFYIFGITKRRAPVQPDFVSRSRSNWTSRELCGRDPRCVGECSVNKTSPTPVRPTDHALSHSVSRQDFRRGNRMSRYYLLSAVAAYDAALPTPPSGGGWFNYDVHVHTEGGEGVKNAFASQLYRFC